MTDLPPSNPLKEAWRLGLGGAKSNLLPGAVLWALGLILVIAYYRSEPVAEAFDQIGLFKKTFSPWFAILSTAVFGSVVPWLMSAALRGKSQREPFRHVPWFFLFWGVHGLQVDWLYRLQSQVFGTGSDAATIISKTLVDQFLWSPFLAIPQVLLSYLFIQNECSPRQFKAALAHKSYLARAIPLIITNWLVWIPAVALIYLFPLPLQLPLQNINLALWCLIVSFFSKNA